MKSILQYKLLFIWRVIKIKTKTNLLRVFNYFLQKNDINSSKILKLKNSSNIFKEKEIDVHFHLKN